MLVVEAGGIGYEVHIPVTTAEKVQGIGKECSLFVHSVYKEDSASLYGFATREDRDFFRLLVEKVSGIGPKIGISILSRMSVELLRSAIASSDVALLSKCPGIGKKTAERLLLELKGKLAPDLGLPGAAVANDTQSDIVQALIALGYSERDAAAALKSLPAEVGVSEGIKLAMKALSK